MLSNNREMFVHPDQSVRTAWISIDTCLLGNRARMDFAAIERAGSRQLQLGPCQSWPPVTGHWRDDGRFVVCDGRHEYLAKLALGIEQIFVAWIEQRDETSESLRNREDTRK